MAIPTSQIIDTNAVSPRIERMGARVGDKAPIAVQDQAIYAALFSQGRNDSELITTSEWDTLENKHKQLVPNSAANWRLWSIGGSQDDGSTTWYTGVWKRAFPPSNSLATFRNWDDFKRHDASVKATMRLLDFDVTTSRGLRWYIGTWGGSPTQQRLVVDVDWTEFTKQWNTLTTSVDKWRLVKIQTYPANARKHWQVAGLFEKGPGDGWDSVSGKSDLVCVTDWNQFLQKHQSFEKQGRPGSYMRLRDFQTHEDFLAGTRSYIGVYQESTFPCRALFGLSWQSLVSEVKTLQFSESLEVYGITRYRTSPLPPMPKPDWKTDWANELQDCVGYCGWRYKGQIDAIYAGGLARAKEDWPANNPKIDGTAWPESFSGITRIHLASVSKAITGVTVMKLLQDKRTETKDKKYNVDTPFYEFVKAFIPDIGPGVEKVTIRNLLQMKSGMEPINTEKSKLDEDQKLDFANIWDFVRGYLKNQRVTEERRGIVWKYRNANYNILEVVVNSITGHGNEVPSYFPTYVRDRILKPMSINTSEFSNLLEPLPENATLYYDSKSIPMKGIASGKIDGVAAAGFIATAQQLGLFVLGVRSSVIGMTEETYETMLSDGLGWDIHDGIFGQYFFHRGGFGWGRGNDKGGLSTVMVILPNSSGAVLLANKEGLDLMDVVVRAYEKGFVRAPEVKASN